MRPTETLAGLYTAVVWHLRGSVVAHIYAAHVLLPQVLATPVGGLLRISSVALHRDAKNNPQDRGTAPRLRPNGTSPPRAAISPRCTDRRAPSPSIGGAVSPPTAQRAVNHRTPVGVANVLEILNTWGSVRFD